MKRCFECIEETPSEDSIIRITHVHYIEDYVLGVSVAGAVERYW
jgi:hypothetical protein